MLLVLWFNRYSTVFGHPVCYSFIPSYISRSSLLFQSSDEEILFSTVFACMCSFSFGAPIRFLLISFCRFAFQYEGVVSSFDPVVASQTLAGKSFGEGRFEKRHIIERNNKTLVPSRYFAYLYILLVYIKVSTNRSSKLSYEIQINFRVCHKILDFVFSL